MRSRLENTVFGGVLLASVGLGILVAHCLYTGGNVPDLWVFADTGNFLLNSVRSLVVFCLCFVLLGLVMATAGWLGGAAVLGLIYAAMFFMGEDIRKLRAGEPNPVRRS
jgi:uncharacterized membrane protein